MSWQEIWVVLKWLLAALIAGFIGQFGKSLALFLMKRRREKAVPKAIPDAPDSAAQSSSSDEDVDRKRLETQAKIEKKRAKTSVKRLKKS
jgi:hypothetical protein